MSTSDSLAAMYFWLAGLAYAGRRPGTGDYWFHVAVGTLKAS